MKKIVLFIKNFQKAAKVSEKLAALNAEIQFLGPNFDDVSDCSLAIIDLNESDFSNSDFLRKLNTNSNIFIVGYVSKVVKKSHDKFKYEGCNMILSNASILKNIERIAREALR